MSSEIAADWSSFMISFSMSMISVEKKKLGEGMRKDTFVTKTHS